MRDDAPLCEGPRLGDVDLDSDAVVVLLFDLKKAEGQEGIELMPRCTAATYAPYTRTWRAHRVEAACPTRRRDSIRHHDGVDGRARGGKRALTVTVARPRVSQRAVGRHTGHELATLSGRANGGADGRGHVD